MTSSHRLLRFIHRVRFEWIGRAPKYRDSLANAHRARALGDWPEALWHFKLASDVRPNNAGVRVQLGHALKECGRIQDAETQYRAAIALAPQSADPYIHLGHSLKLQGRRPEAADAYAKAISLAPMHLAASAELISIGARDRLSKSLYGREATSRSIQSLGTALEEIRQAFEALTQASTFPAEAWDEFRRTYPPLPPPESVGEDAEAPVILLDARSARPSQVRASIRSVMDQTHRQWRCIVIGESGLDQHPVASTATLDTRFVFVDGAADEILAPTFDAPSPALILSAGVVLNPLALAWFRFAAGRVAAEIVYADHDHHTADWKAGPTAFAPALFGLPGLYDLASTPSPPPVIYLADCDIAGIAANLRENAGPETNRAIAVNAMSERRRVTHVPRLLSSIEIKSEKAVPVSFAPAESSTRRDDAKIRVVIPTRDHAKLLSDCIESLRRFALRPELLEFVVMDNRSVESETAALLANLRRDSVIDSVSLDEPFNWSRANNLGAAASTFEGILAFANNDLEMLSLGWDDELRRILADRAVGAVGARLLYPDGTLQHAGIVLGAVTGRPVHEGRGVAADIGGPTGRWLRTREASAVTGAFLAVRSEVFDSVAGFDEKLAIAYNDVDFCLRLREKGLSVVMAASIEAIHHESKTRGLALDAEQIAWDTSEFSDLYRTWGEAAIQDSYVSGQWTFAAERSFDGLRSISMSEILDAIDAHPPKRSPPP